MILTLGDDDFDRPDALEAMIESLHAGSRPRVGLNLRLLTFLNSSAFGLLIRLKKRLEARGGELALIQPSEFVTGTLLTLGLDGYFTVFGSSDAALAHFHGGDDETVERLRIRHREIEDALVLTFAGELDAFNLERYAARVEDLLEAGHVKLAYDLSDLTFASSGALGDLIRTKKRAREKGGDVVLIRPSVFVWRTLRTLGLGDLFLLFDTAVAAAAHLCHGDDTGIVDPRTLTDDDDGEATGSRSIVFWNEEDDRIIGVGRIVGFDEKGVTFRWPIPEEAKAIDTRLSEGSRLSVKFRQPLAGEAHLFTARARIVAVETSLRDIDVEEATLRIEYTDLARSDRELLARSLAEIDALRD
jgi:anti-sigma B factor antagonist